MRRIVFFLSVSVDGFFEGPDRDIGWHKVDEEVHAHLNEVLGAMSAFLEGRITYQLMEGYWPGADADPAVPPTAAQFAEIWRRTPKIVYSRTLESAGPNATIVRDVVPEDVAALRARPGGDMAVGGPDLAATFIRLGLVDEYRLYVHPVAIGRGRRFLPPDARIDLSLVETRAFTNGVVLHRYEPRRHR